jgi:ketol-acid reductoisomerase
VTDETRKEMQRILDDVRSGRYAAAWIAENEAGRPWFEAKRREERAHPIEQVGAQLRSMMPFIKPVSVTEEDVVAVGARQNG